MGKIGRERTQDERRAADGVATSVRRVLSGEIVRHCCGSIVVEQCEDGVYLSREAALALMRRIK